VPTIRYYEQVGLLPEPRRTEGKQRRYEKAHLDRVNFIRHGRELGFSLDAIRELLELAGSPDAPCAEADRIAERQLRDVSRRIERLSALRAELERMLEQCRGGAVATCRVLEALSDHHACEPTHGSTMDRTPNSG
jgi:DNA-binding transcriptional MerR regulator